MDVDGVFRLIGELGRQQLVYIAYLLMLNTYAAFHMIQVQHTDACSYSSNVCQLSLSHSQPCLTIICVVLLCPLHCFVLCTLF